MSSKLGGRSRCCAAYSVVGAMFTLWVAIMLHAQPFFILGVDNSKDARDNAFGAFVMFLATFVASSIGVWYDSNIDQDQIESAAAGNGSETEYQLAQDVPSYGTN
mmetsp:Transcript_1105/g.2184  ORF Transcript_1105/g.2184 Transcript_1105/m.2184 type:complete len:105 (-) Transcript_1105:161-475(-)|eukprot:CAMPEP_0113655740 /NCGR_PEP_ID=MMETSP0017_2-20120614/29892_1 /TAXON_ID=2856 /ORGANISM="Cylindrotheca closterium" /LENGTH=104 /DNA_ID=CAMNT_0000569057 /DNA_START=33 /DNA_END=347 /DNA_ORIENTATION=- /assembly_acc=CAM_ASM_000147